MADEPKDTEGNEPSTVDQVADLVSAFKETLKEVKAAPAPVAVAAPVATESPAEKHARLDKAWNEVKVTANEMAANGEFAESQEYLQTQYAALNKVESVDQTTTPLFKSLKGTVKRAAKTDHKDMFEKYGPEIMELIEARPAEEQIDSDVWDSMVNQVKANHLDEIIDAKLENLTKEREQAQPGFATLVAGGSGPTKSDFKASDLTADQLEIAEGLGYDAETYAKLQATYNDRKIGAQTVALVPPGNPKPGEF